MHELFKIWIISQEERTQVMAVNVDVMHTRRKDVVVMCERCKVSDYKIECLPWLLSNWNPDTMHFTHGFLKAYSCRLLSQPHHLTYLQAARENVSYTYCGCVGIQKAFVAKGYISGVNLPSLFRRRVEFCCSFTTTFAYFFLRVNFLKGHALEADYIQQI